MRRSKLKLPHIKLQIARGIALGLSQQRIAEEIGMSQPTVSRMIRNPTVVKAIIRQRRRIIAKTPDAIGRHLRIINDDKYYDYKNPDLLRIGLDSARQIFSLCLSLQEKAKNEEFIVIKEKALDRLVKDIIRRV